MKWFYYLRVMFRTRYALMIAVTLALCICADAQNHGLGLFNSPKGFGISYEQEGTKSTEFFSSYSLYADIYGLCASRTPHPGIKFNASRLYYIDIINGQQTSYIFYVGPGITAGYAHDFEKDYWLDFYKTLSKRAGAILALSGTGGCRITFNRSIMLDLSLTIEAGMHLRKENGSTKLSLYKNGIIQTLYPQLTIYTLF